MPEHRVLDLRHLPALGAGEEAKQASEQGVKHRHDHGVGMLPDGAGFEANRSSGTLHRPGSSPGDLQDLYKEVAVQNCLPAFPLQGDLMVARLAMVRSPSPPPRIPPELLGPPLDLGAAPPARVIGRRHRERRIARRDLTGTLATNVEIAPELRQVPELCGQSGADTTAGNGPSHDDVPRTAAGGDYWVVLSA